MSKLVLDATGNGNQAVYADRGQGLVNRLIIAGGTGAVHGIHVSRYHGTIYVRNNIVYNFGNGGDDSGIQVGSLYTDGFIYVYNNTCCNRTYLLSRETGRVGI